MLTGVDAGPELRRRLPRRAAGDTVADGLRHAAPCSRRLTLGGVCARLAAATWSSHSRKTPPRVDRPRGADSCCNTSWVLRAMGRKIGGQRQPRQGVGVQRLGVPLGGGHRLDACARHVVEHPGRSVTTPMFANIVRERKGLALLGAELCDQLTPTATGRPAVWHSVKKCPDAPENDSRGAAVDVRRRSGPP